MTGGGGREWISYILVQLFKGARHSSGLKEFGFTPKKLFINLFRANQVFQLLQPRKGSVLKNLLWHVNSLEQFVKLLRPPPRIPAAPSSPALSNG